MHKIPYYNPRQRPQVNEQNAGQRCKLLAEEKHLPFHRLQLLDARQAEELMPALLQHVVHGAVIPALQTVNGVEIASDRPILPQQLPFAALLPLEAA